MLYTNDLLFENLSVTAQAQLRTALTNEEFVIAQFTSTGSLCDTRTFRDTERASAKFREMCATQSNPIALYGKFPKGIVLISERLPIAMRERAEAERKAQHAAKQQQSAPAPELTRAQKAAQTRAANAEVRKLAAEAAEQEANELLAQIAAEQEAPELESEEQEAPEFFVARTAVQHWSVIHSASGTEVDSARTKKAAQALCDAMNAEAQEEEQEIESLALQFAQENAEAAQAEVLAEAEALEAFALEFMSQEQSLSSASSAARTKYASAPTATNWKRVENADRKLAELREYFAVELSAPEQEAINKAKNARNRAAKKAAKRERKQTAPEALDTLRIPFFETSQEAKQRTQSTKDAQRVAIAANNSSASHVAKSTQAVKENAAMTKSTKTQKTSGITQQQIINAILATRENLSRVNERGNTMTLINPERAALITPENAILDASGTKLRAYANIDNAVLLETLAEMKERKAARRERKVRNESASAPELRADRPEMTQTAAEQALAALDTLKALGIDTSALLAQTIPAKQQSAPKVANAKSSAPKVAKAAKQEAPVVAAPKAAKSTKQEAPKVASAPASGIGAENAKQIGIICNKLAKLNASRSQLEKANKINLDTLSVQELRDVSKALSAQIAAKS